MCGIAGTVCFGGAAQPEAMEQMLATMVHRGPHARGTLVDGGAAIGMQRLAIIDIAGGDQPIFNEDGTVAVVMNGEIYNFRELRRELQARGHRFATHADTEVIVHLYEEHGERLVEHLQGMFAFAIWDGRRQGLLLGRDRVGKKPLFIARRAGRVAFASELYSLLQDPEIERVADARAVAAYLTLQYVPHSLCAVRGVEKLAPAHTLWVDADEARHRRYWRLAVRPAAAPAPPAELAERLRALIWEATRRRLISEAPLGAFLSGGIDSSAVVAAMADQMSEPVKTFSVGFSDDPSHDELRYARMVAERFSTDHHEFDVRPEAVEIAERLARHYGEPYGDPSAVPSFYLAQMTSRHVTVALNGDGGDESFAGYRRYVINRVADRCAGVPGARALLPMLLAPVGQGPQLNSTRSRLHRFAATLALDPAARYARWRSTFTAADRARDFTPELLAELDGWSPDESITAAWQASEGGGLSRMLSVDIATYLPDDLLVKMDIATMAYSVEGRSPFLDTELMEFAATLPDALKLRGREGKRILKMALRGVVPDEILTRRKMGFGVPLARWFRQDLRDLPCDVLLGGDSFASRFVRREAIERMLAEHATASADHSMRLWLLLQLEMWHRHVLRAPLVGRQAAGAAQND